MTSGFAPVLALEPEDDPADGHAVCGVGLKLGDVSPQTDPSLSFRDASTSVVGVYLHDDRLGPYAAAELMPWTQGKSITSRLSITWPDGVEKEYSSISALIIPVPMKLRLTITRMRALGMAVAQAAATKIPQFGREITLSCHYARNTTYRADAHGYGLSRQGLYQLSCELVLSRYIGVIALSVPAGPLFDVLLDATETSANPAALACVRRANLPKEAEEVLRSIATRFGARCVT